MVVFPILNFVLPLMLTSILLVNSQECLDCKDINKNKSIQNKQFENYNEKISELEDNLINQEKLELPTNKGNAY